ncbi:MAG: hypothetical protein JKY56_27245 [Kofleriaceae bacterium]|nr:hypothetical protein [Kofleriaceae bacterium]
MIVEDPAVNRQAWDAISLVATYDGGEELVGYRYMEIVIGANIFWTFARKLPSLSYKAMS